MAKGTTIARDLTARRGENGEGDKKKKTRANRRFNQKKRKFPDNFSRIFFHQFSCTHGQPVHKNAKETRLYNIYCYTVTDNRYNYRNFAFRLPRLRSRNIVRDGYIFPIEYYNRQYSERIRVVF